MTVHPLAGRPAPPELLVDVSGLVRAYYDLRPDAAEPAERVAFGTSGHRGSSLRRSFNEAHILAVCQAIVEHRRAQGITGPLYLGMDTHALSVPARETAVEVFAANDVAIVLEAGLGYTPTPVVSHAILTHNRGRTSGLADGVVVTPSHNPPEDGGFKYNPPSGGPADTATTRAIQDRANELLRGDVGTVRRVPWARALAASATRRHDLAQSYVDDLVNVLDVGAIAGAGLRLGVDPLGGASVALWERIAATHGLDLTVVNRAVDPRFAFMTVDRDGKIRMDCSSPWAMAGLIALRDRFDVAFGNDADADRHGIVTRSAGLMSPNHFLTAAVWYLFQRRPAWRSDAAVGKTVVSSALIDRAAAALGRRLLEVPVGFKWFVDGLLEGTIGFAGEESAGATLLRRDGTPWTTDKDGVAACLLAAEMTAAIGRDPAALYDELAGRFGRSAYERLDVPCSAAEKAALGALGVEPIALRELAGEPIVAVLTRAPGNGAAIGGLKLVTESGWCAVRPSGTEDVYKIYAESFRGEDHLRRIVAEAQALVAARGTTPA